MHPTLIILEMFTGTYAFAVWRELIPCGGWCIAAPRAFIPVIGLETCRLGLAIAGCQHLHRRVAGKDGLAGQDVALDGLGQRLQQRGRLTNPSSQCGAIHIQAFMREDLRLAVRGQVIRILVDQYMGQEPWARNALPRARSTLRPTPHPQSQQARSLQSMKHQPHSRVPHQSADLAATYGSGSRSSLNVAPFALLTPPQPASDRKSPASRRQTKNASFPYS